MNCASCKHWLREKRTRYGDGSEIVTFQAPEGRGNCDVLLSQSTTADFGCLRFEGAQDGDQVAITVKEGAPWQHWHMGICPDCHGVAHTCAMRGRCAGTGQVRYYDDGYIGDELKRRHPRENEAAVAVDPGTIVKPQPSPNVL